MKFMTSQFAFFMKSKIQRRNIKLLMRYILVIFAIITTYSILFHFIMLAENQSHSWMSGLYWTITTMTTLGFGDIVFTSDLGRFFSVIVMLSGVVFLLVMLPFTFIQFFYAPWVEAEAKNRTPQQLSEETKNHILITTYDPVTIALIEKLESYKKNYIVIVEDTLKAMELYDADIRVAVGKTDDPETYRKMRADKASLVVATGSDERNTNIAFTVKEVGSHIPVLTTANSKDSVDILTMAGSSIVLQVSHMLGNALARRVLSSENRASVIGQFSDLLVAESPMVGTPLIGKTLAESKLPQKIGVTVVGIWERGQFFIPTHGTLITANSVLVLAGSEKQISLFNEIFFIYQPPRSPVLIIGGGRVGVAVLDALKARSIKCRIIEKDPERMHRKVPCINGNAADIEVLKKAGINSAPAVILTTRDDATNIYLAKYCRSLRPDIQIISRSEADRNVSTLHRAGADFVISYSSLGAGAIFNYMVKEGTVMLAEGLNIFTSKVSATLAGKTLMNSGIRETTGCNLIAIEDGKKMRINPDPSTVLRKGKKIILIGTVESERKFTSMHEK